MPGGVDGLKLAAAVRDRWPPIEIIVTSGANLKAGTMLPDRSVFFPKPYSDMDIVSAVKRMAAVYALG
jgi:hypothetical protein